MLSIHIIQIMAIIYFIYALRLKVWQTSINTFVVITTFFVVTISREVVVLKDIWIDYHLTIIAIAMTFLMGRVVYQSAKKKYQKFMCSDCTNYNRRSTDKNELGGM